MNNKQKNTQPNNVSDGDGSINTKKGFLISLPGKNKKSDGETGGIVMAKTINNTDSDNNSGKKTNQQNARHSNNHGNNNHNRNKHNRHKGQKNKNGQNSSAESSKQQNNTKNVPVQKVESNTQTNQNHSHKKNDKNRRNEKRDRHQNRNHENHSNNNNNRTNNTNMDFGLSPLSKDMQSFSKFSSNNLVIDSGHSSDKSELSLEEKYKNAIPLAEQIALEEEKRRIKPKSMRTHQIDRSLVANKPGVDNTEETENTQVNSSKQYEVVGIRFREAGKIYYFDPDGKEIPYGTPVIVETARGAEYGYTAISNRLVPHSNVVPPLKKIKRIATGQDTQKYVANKALEADAAVTFKQKVAALGLEMNLVFVEYTFDNSKLLFYFTAETRIDFRELVKELASVFRTRIELRQIGVRDEAKMLGGLGVCGRSVCCNSFLGDFAQVSIKMAKEQGLSLNSAKISGSCGKLMCCLRYEDKVYEEEIARTPKVGSIVETSEGRGVVTESHALKGTVKVTLDSSPDSPAKPFGRDEVKVVGFNKAAVKEDAEEMKELKALEDNND